MPGGRKIKKRAPYEVPYEEEREWITAVEVAYLFQVAEAAVVSWARSGRLIAIPWSGHRRFLEEEVRRLYGEVGGSPEGGWRTWPRTPGRGLRQAR